MNNVLKDSLFVSQNRKFDEIQSVVRQFSAEYVGNSIIKDNILLLYRTMQERKKLHWNCFVFQFMMMNYGH